MEFVFVTKMILSFDDAKPKDKEGLGSPLFQPYSGSRKIIKRVFFTRTEMTIYPNGKTFQKTQSWFDKQIYDVKTKKKKTVTSKKVSIGEAEEY